MTKLDYLSNAAAAKRCLQEPGAFVDFLRQPPNSLLYCYLTHHGNPTKSTRPGREELIPCRLSLGDQS